MNLDVSPKYMINLIEQIDKKIWLEFGSYKKVEAYIKRFIKTSGGYNNQNFYIRYKEYDEGIDLRQTLHDIEDDEIILKIAVDIGLEIPSLIYAIPEIRGILSSGYETAAKTFENAIKKVSSEPNVSICSANSALESIIKHICEEGYLEKCNQRDTLYKLTTHILKEFDYFPTGQLNNNIKNIGSSLLNVAQNIEALRSNHTDISHGKTSEDYIIHDDLYAKFIINAVSTVGLFLLNYYEKRYKPQQSTGAEDIPF